MRANGLRNAKRQKMGGGGQRQRPEVTVLIHARHRGG